AGAQAVVNPAVTARMEVDDVGDGERAGDGIAQFLADFDVFEVPRLGAAGVVVAIQFGDALEIFIGVAGRLDRHVLAFLRRGFAFGHDFAVGVGRYHFAALVQFHVAGDAVDLAAGKLGRLNVDTDHTAIAEQRVARVDRLEEFPLAAGHKHVDAAEHGFGFGFQFGIDRIAQHRRVDHASHHRRCDDAAPAGAFGVVGIAEQRVVAAATLCEVTNGVDGGGLDLLFVFRRQIDANHQAGAVNIGIGEFVGGGLVELLLQIGAPRLSPDRLAISLVMSVWVAGDYS